MGDSGGVADGAVKVGQLAPEGVAGNVGTQDCVLVGCCRGEDRGHPPQVVG